MRPGPDNVQTNDTLITFISREMKTYPDLELETSVRHVTWGSEIDVSYGRRLWKIPLPRRQVTILATHAGTIVKITKHGRQVRT